MKSITAESTAMLGRLGKTTRSWRRFSRHQCRSSLVTRNKQFGSSDRKSSMLSRKNWRPTSWPLYLSLIQSM